MTRSAIVSLILFWVILTPLYSQENRVFEFGKSANPANTNLITEPIRYNSEVGYGFDFENTDQVVFADIGKSGSGFCTAPVPFYFSVGLPEGNYEITVTIGNPGSSSKTTIKAEARRLMVLDHELKKGKSDQLKFIINIRSPRINATDSIRLKSREYNYVNWDNRLTLEFSGINQAVQRIEIRPAEKVTTVFLAGNSTVTDQDNEPWASWGQLITNYFDAGIAVANFAESGESLASFKGAGRLTKVLSLVKPGDYLFIEFGHNDQKKKGQGIGPWASFTDLLTEFVTLAREKGAIPVLITPTQRRSFDDSGNITLTHGDYPDAMRKVARDLNVPLIDLHQMTKILYESWGPECSKKAFVHYPAGTFPGQEKELKDNTHFNAFGAHEVALCVLKGMIEKNIGPVDHIVNMPKKYNPENPTKPGEWSVPESPRYISKKPEGN